MIQDAFPKKQVADSFSRFAKSYDKHAFIQKEIGKRLIERAQYLKQPPLRILDLGSGPGIMFNLLRKSFPKAQIIGLDIAWGMVHSAKAGFWQSLVNKTHVVQADMESVPFTEQSFDMVFSNCAFQWSNDLTKLFAQIKHLLKPQGSLFYSTFGPDTLYEFKHLWSEVDDKPHVHEFLDMHHYGDAMLKSGLIQPVVDQEHVTLTYTRLKTLLDDLKYTGARNFSPKRTRGLTGRTTFNKLENAFVHVLNNHKLFNCTYEVIYGHAIKPDYKLSADKPIPLYIKK